MLLRWKSMAIYDCFTFYNEFELLELRLELLYPVMDHFVICECNKTQRGDDKPFYFAENKERFAKYLDKIINIQLTDPPTISHQRARSAGNVFAGSWDIENYQRNGIMRGLTHCQPNDLVIITDLDEIPNPEVLLHLDEQSLHLPSPMKMKKAWLKNVMMLLLFLKDKATIKRIVRGEGSVKDVLPYMPVAMELDLFYYFMNCKSRGRWHLPILSYYKNMFMPQVMRMSAYSTPYIRKAGWHLSYMGGLERIKRKMQSIVEGNDTFVKNDAYIFHCLDNGIDLFGRKGEEFTYDFLPLDQLDIPNVKTFLAKYPYLYHEPK